jgi:NADH:ubiquinone oxidoreductase subunit 5 (subunit L)/multisubunit Na+/H+ antiporter MnhA subunit/multisubunit Na+/H+ antiporter MnhB subunit
MLPLIPPFVLILLFLGVFIAWTLSRPGIGRYFTNPRAGWVLALIPASAFGLLLYATTQMPLTFSIPWIPSLNIHFSLYFDGLSALFALLITGIGTLVVIYTGYYFDHATPTKDKGRKTTEDSQKASAPEPSSSVEYRFFAYTLLFMFAMLGVVLAGDLITLFLFWEGTSISSFLLIAYKYKDEAARKGAFKSLFITGGGGIAMLAGFLFVMHIAGGADFQTLLASKTVLLESPLYPVFFALIALGAFTKSAQFPAHIWLPEAMSAPTPASAFLHSATMVKAGVYLLARLNPVLGENVLWVWTLTIVGLTTMMVGAYLGFKQNDLKPLLAYSTISQLGVLVALIGQTSEIASKALVVSILAHALYKSALFMAAGIIDHETHTRDIRILGGLRKKMPIMFFITSIAALSMAGLPPLFGFLAKETLLATTIGVGDASILVSALTVLAGALILGQAALLVWGVFIKQPGDVKNPPPGHDPKWGFWLAPGIPAALSLLIGISPIEPAFLAHFLADAAQASYGDKVKVSLALWTGINPPLILSLVAVAFGSFLFWQRSPIRAWMSGLLPNLTLNGLFDGVIAGVDKLSEWATLLQAGKLRVYLQIMLASIVGFAFIFQALSLNDIATRLAGVSFAEFGAFLSDYRPGLRLFALSVAAIATFVSLRVRRDVASVIALGVAGLGIAMWMALLPSPDVALVQVVVDILATVILLMSLSLLDRSWRDRANDVLHPNPGGHAREIAISLALGVLVASMAFVALDSRPESDGQLSAYYWNNAKANVGATDLVGAIVVDYRATDTILEIAVFAMAALGVYGVLHYAVGHRPTKHVHVPTALSADPKKFWTPLHPGKPLGIFGDDTSDGIHLMAYVMLPIAMIIGFSHVLFGHDGPGDGFTAGVIISLAMAIWYMVFGYEMSRARLAWFNRHGTIGVGLSLAVVNATLVGLLTGNFAGHLNYGEKIFSFLGLPESLLKLLVVDGVAFTSSLVFEIAICLTVVGAATLILDAVGHPRDMESEEDE